jgi:hypothetical protein
MPDANGIFRDDSGNEVKLGDAEGDIRPAPVLMPAPFGTRSRVRSKWLDMGAVVRRMTVQGGDGNPRGVEVQPGLNIGDDFGPVPEFEAVETGDPDDPQGGYVRVVDDNLGGVLIDYPSVVRGLKVASIKANVPFRGQSAFEVTLRAPNPQLGAQNNRYSHYAVQLVEGATPLGQFRILGHTATTLYLSSESGVLPNVTASSNRDIDLSVIEKFFDIFTNGVEGFPQTFVGRSGSQYPSVRIPRANVRLRFAFHQNPGDPQAKRYPPAVASGQPKFFADWDNAAEIEKIRTGGYRYVLYDILFNTQYEWDPAFPNTNSLSPDTPLPEVRRLVLPYRY